MCSEKTDKKESFISVSKYSALTGKNGINVISALARLSSGEEYYVLVPIGTDVFYWYFDVLDTRIENERKMRREDEAFAGISTDEFECELKEHGLEYVRIK